MFSPRCTTPLVLLVLLAPTYGRVFDRCELARELVTEGIPIRQINEWVCVVEISNRERNTSTITSNPDGSSNYGIFQINSQYWCDETSPGKMCKVQCSDLFDDDLYEDVLCALTIQEKQGFYAWKGYAEKCDGGKAEDVFFCF